MTLRHTVEVPRGPTGLDAAEDASIVLATIRPAFRIFSISSADFRMITARPLPILQRSLDHFGRRRLGVHLMEQARSS